MAKVHDRILEVNFTANTTGHTVGINSINYYRTRGELEDGVPFALTFDNSVAAISPVETRLGELVPPPAILRLVFTGI